MLEKWVKKNITEAIWTFSMKLVILSGVPFPNLPQQAEKEVFQFSPCQDNDSQTLLSGQYFQLCSRDQ